jgi:hypothetical protein
MSRGSISAPANGIKSRRCIPVPIAFNWHLVAAASEMTGHRYLVLLYSGDGRRLGRISTIDCGVSIAPCGASSCVPDELSHEALAEHGRARSCAGENSPLSRRYAAGSELPTREKHIVRTNR